MKNWLILILFTPLFARAQWTGPRQFLDAPAIYATSPDLNKIDQRAGLGGEFMYSLGSHNFCARIGAGTNYTAGLQSGDSLKQSLRFNPFVRLEVGGGLYRTNGNQCAKTNASAFTAMPIAGVIYDFQDEEANAIVGVELAHFVIRDMRRNTEIFLRGEYLLPADRPTADFGFRVFFNLRERASVY